MKIEYIIIIILLIALNFSFIKCAENENKAISAIKTSQANTEYYENKLGSKTAYIEVLETDSKTLKKSILSKDDSLRKLASEFNKIKSILKWKTKAEFDNIKVRFKDTIPCNFRKFGRYDTKWLDFNYQVSSNGFEFENFNIRNETTVITGIKRKWFLGRPCLKTDITNSNPYFQTKEIQSTVVKLPIRFYDTRLFNIGVGYVLGTLINSHGSKRFENWQYSR